MSGLDLLVHRLFDYAGMFPPAKLDLRAALRESARFPRNLHRPNIVATDLVISFSHLAELNERLLVDAGFGSTCCTLCVVGVEVSQLPDAAAIVQAFNAANAPIIKIVALEVHGEQFLAHTVAVARAELGQVQLFLEPRWTAAQWPRRQAALFDLLSSLKTNGRPVGLKVRGVGPTAVSNTTLAQIVPAVASLPIPFKATQGLHSPLVDASHELGFLNLAMALRLSQSKLLKPAELRALLGERDAAAYAVNDGISWRGHQLLAEEIQLVRADLPFTIGSCSIAEPDQALAALWG